MKLQDFDFRIWNGEKYLKQKYNKGMFGYCERGYAVGFVGDRHKLVYEIIQGTDSNEYDDNDYEWIYDLDLDENDCEVELWTGLYDKNNKKIYEGDILQSDVRKYLVRYVEDESGLEIVELSNEGYVFFVSEICNELEIIGNIHENKDLLKE